MRGTMFLLPVLLLFPLPALAGGETVRDVTLPLTAVLLFLAALAAWLVRRHILPFLERHALREEAEAAVRCAEAVLGRGQGGAKWDRAMALLRSRGFAVDEEVLRTSLKAAWQAMDLMQVLAGVKGKDGGGEAAEPPLPGRNAQGIQE